MRSDADAWLEELLRGLRSWDGLSRLSCGPPDGTLRHHETKTNRKVKEKTEPSVKENREG